MGDALAGLLRGEDVGVLRADFQERRAIDADGDGSLSSTETAAYRGEACERLERGLHLVVDGTAAPLTSSSSDLSLPVGQAGLRTLRLTCAFRASVAPRPTHDLAFEDANYADRLGWHEVTAAGDWWVLKFGEELVEELLETKENGKNKAPG